MVGLFVRLCGILEVEGFVGVVGMQGVLGVVPLLTTIMKKLKSSQNGNGFIVSSKGRQNEKFGRVLTLPLSRSESLQS